MDIIKGYNDYKQYTFNEGECALTKAGNGIIVSDRKYNYSSLGVHANEIFKDATAFKSTVSLTLTSHGEAVKITPYIKLIIEYIGLTYTLYEYGKGGMVEYGKSTELTVSAEIPFGATIKDIICYFIQSNTSSFPDITVERFEVEKAIPAENVEARPKENRISYQKDLKFGVVRWDAYYKTNYESEKDVSYQVARSLSPAHYHFMAPYFTQYIGADKVAFGEATQEQLDDEILLANDAGIDYFAYCWYRNNDPMSYARKQHANSKYSNLVKMAALINVNSMDDETINTLAENMTGAFYLRFDNRPVIFVYDCFKVTDEYLNKIKVAAKGKGINEEIYFVGMASQINPFLVNKAMVRKMDAISAYSYGAPMANMPYSVYADTVEREADAKLSYADKIDAIPLISCGRDQRPRIEHPTTWAYGYGDKYVVPPTGEELYKHISSILGKLKASPEKCRPMSALAYAWNEHDEGGWCCPTWRVDENGIPEKNSDGNYVLDRTYLDAIKRALKDFREN